jgi:hypothetical protein
MDIKRGGSQASQEAPAAHLTGNVRIDPLSQPGGAQRALGADATFERCTPASAVRELLRVPRRDCALEVRDDAERKDDA